MSHRNLSLALSPCVALWFFAAAAWGQSPPPYPNAVTDRLIHPKTGMAPPPANLPFPDPDFGSLMVRVTDASTDSRFPGRFFRTEASGQANLWSVDSTKFYVIEQGGGALAFSFNPSTMAIGSLPAATPGQGLILPLRAGATFSFVDPDLIYGTTSKTPLTIDRYRFSTGVKTPVIDTTTCGTEPALVASKTTVSDDDVSLSGDDTRISISEGGPIFGADMFVIVDDKNLGCRWYNTQTGQIGGQWGPSGNASVATSYLIRHAYLSRDGNSVQIMVNHFGFYVWDLATLDVTPCPITGPLICGGYSALGYDSLINGGVTIDEMNILKRPLSNLADIAQLVLPLPPPHYWGEEKHFTWSNAFQNDDVPVCGSNYVYDADGTITRPFEGEIFCIETDGGASTVWRFAHNRATYEDGYFNTQPLGSISMDGRFFLFSSDWDAQLGTESNGAPRSDVWIVKLD